MKAVLVAISLAANLALLAALAVRPEFVPASIRDFWHRVWPTAPAVPLKTPPIKAHAPRITAWQRVFHDNPAAFVARLRAAGFPAAVIRGLVTAEINARYDVRVNALRDPPPGTAFWQIRSPYDGYNQERLEEMNQLYRDRARATRELFGDEFFASDDVTEAQRRQFGNLSRSKIDALQRIEDDYKEMNGAVKAAAGGVTLPADREKLALLAREKQADLTALLSPEELVDYTLRSSPITSWLRSRMGEFEPTDAEFLGLYQAQDHLNARLGPNPLGTIDDAMRRQAQAEYMRELRGLLGDTRYAEFLRESNDEFQQLTRITERNQMPREKAMQMYELRDVISRESYRIVADASLAIEAKRNELRQLVQKTRYQINVELGPTAGPSYLKIADRWLTVIERGAAVSFVRAHTLASATENGNHSWGASPDYLWLPQPGR